ncbi:hypothetical protein ABZ153_30555 [Streptomyces sp. NPDC006290]|uniref:hypothetical protein n=1 Tax=unclassified Streptomyces TaxID=2593676 RepID=UPI0033AF5B89
MTEQTTEVGQTTSAEQTTVVEQTAPAERTEPEAVPQTEPQPDSRAAEPPAVTPPAGPEAAVSPLPEEPSAGAEVIAADEPQVPPVKVRKDRRVLRAVLRWTAATVVFAAVGSSVAYGIAGMERTDVPGLATQADGRWDYPTITKPPLPSGSPGPFASSNKAGTHYADLRKLLLPAPKNAKADAALRGDDGWLAQKTFLAQYAEPQARETLGDLLTGSAVRHIAARGWTAADGTHTRIYLLQFDTAAVAEDLASAQLTNYDSPHYALRGAALTERDEQFPERAAVDEITRYAYTESKPYGAEQVREAYVSAGDTIALVVQSRKGSASAVPFQQTVVLQSQLLG